MYLTKITNHSIDRLAAPLLVAVSRIPAIDLYRCKKIKINVRNSFLIFCD